MSKAFFDQVAVKKNIREGNHSTAIFSGLNYPIYDYHFVDDKTLIINTKKDLISFDLQNNKRNWTVPASKLKAGLDKIDNPLSVSGNKVLCKTSADSLGLVDRLHILDARSGKRLHAFDREGLSSSVHSILFSNKVVAYNYKDKSLKLWDADNAKLIDSIDTKNEPDRYDSLQVYGDSLIVQARNCINVYQYVEGVLQCVAEFNAENIRRMKRCNDKLLVSMRRCGENSPDIYVLDAQTLAVIHHGMTHNVFHDVDINYPNSPNNPATLWNWTSIDDTVFDGKTAYVIDGHGVLVKYDFANERYEVLDTFGSGLYRLDYSEGVLMISSDKMVRLYDPKVKALIQELPLMSQGMRRLQDGVLYCSEESVLYQLDYNVIHKGEMFKPNSASYDAVERLERDGDGYCCIM